MAKWNNKNPKANVEPPLRREPQIGVKFDEVRQPVEAEKVDYFHLKASWRVKRIQLVDPYGFHEITQEGIGALRARLANFETMTWREIFLTAKKQNHSIPVSRLRCERARRWMKENMPDQPELWTLRVSGAQRIWGIFSEGAYQVIFWDPEHLIYPTNV